MSFTATVDAQIKDLDALDVAVKKCGGTVTQQKRFKTDDGTFDCDARIEIPGCARQVGIVRQEDETFALQYDNYGEGRALDSAFGRQCGTLMKHYATEVVKKQLKTRGFIVRERLDQETGETLLTTRKA